MAQLPYNPTRILSSPADDHSFYIFQPSAASSLNSQLSLLNVSRSFDAGNLPSTPLFDPLPFAADGKGYPFTPAVEPQGDILVWSGDCRDGAEGSRLWRFNGSTESKSAMGDWTTLNTEIDHQTGNGSSQGARYLASALSFSSSLDTTSAQMYVFGGMCPDADSSAKEIWTQSGNYSNTMVTIRPSQNPSADDFIIGTSADRGPPTAGAGFTITPLEPTYSLPPGSDGNSTRHQNQNYVLLGGHTAQAFINMSQAAIFSLPEESWSFLAVDSPSSAAPKVDLAARAPPTVEPRSGHTAVITSSGDRMVVFGGWVGDINTPAQPQLAVLHLGDGYGGTGPWRWSIPPQTELGLSEGTGLFGHGAVMLPGSVMLIMGGYTIPKGGKLRLRSDDLRPNEHTYLFNTTSDSWISSYNPPTEYTPVSNPAQSPSRDRSHTNKAGLAAGLTFGILAVIMLILLYWWYRRRLKRRQATNLAVTEDHPVGPGHAETKGTSSEMSDTKVRGGYSWARPNPDVRNNSKEKDADADAERTGLLFEVPSPTRGLRRSLHSRGSYQPAPRFDEGRRAHGPSTIHRIDEGDEYDEDGTNEDSFEKMAPLRGADVFQSAPVFTYYRNSEEHEKSPTLPSFTRARDMEVRNWVSDWAVTDALANQQAGRVSPDKTDRTSSSLSEQSTRSTISAHSYQPSVGRSISQRSAGFFSSKALASATEVVRAVSPLESHGDQTSPLFGLSTDHGRPRSLAAVSNSQQMKTPGVGANSSFRQLQAESEALLGSYHDPNQISPTRSKVRPKSWMGSVRRAFTGAERSMSTSPPQGNSATSSPILYQRSEEGIPRRAASAGGMLWQKRQGAKDWDAEADRVTRHDGTRDATASDEGDEEWDVESAVERRMVQVMFTVPREKLRVVNGGPDGDGESILSVNVHDPDDPDDMAEFAYLASAADQEEPSESREARRKGKGKGKERATDVGRLHF